MFRAFGLFYPVIVGYHEGLEESIVENKNTGILGSWVETRLGASSSYIRSYSF